MTYDWAGLDGQTVPFAFTQGGVTASFTSSTDPNSFLPPGPFTVAPNNGLFSTLPAEILTNEGYQGILHVSFSQTLSSLSLQFATADLLNLSGYSAYINFYSAGHLVGGLTSIGAVPTGDLFPQGTFNYTNAAGFDSIVVGVNEADGMADALAVGDITVTTVPGPGALALALAGLSAFSWRRQDRR